MKKLLVFGLVIGGLAAMTSCKKEYTCECTSTVTGLAPIVTSSTITAKKKDAEAACNTSATTGFSTVSCELK